MNIVGIAGLFLALGFIGYLFVMSGSGVNNIAETFNQSSLKVTGNFLIGMGLNIIYVLIALAIIFVIVLIYKMLE
jgi:hypothetical protein